MTNEQMERAIEFLLDYHAKFSADMGELKEVIGELKDVQEQQVQNINRLTADMQTLREVQTEQTRNINLLTGAVESIITEMRDAINGLIVGSQATRQLAEGVARLEVQTSQRVTGLERRVSDLESKQ
jgi:cell division protein FtsB